MGNPATSHVDDLDTAVSSKRHPVTPLDKQQAQLGLAARAGDQMRSGLESTRGTTRRWRVGAGSVIVENRWLKPSRWDGPCAYCTVEDPWILLRGRIGWCRYFAHPG